MASRDIVLTVGEDDWLTLQDAADDAGMRVEAYLSWCVGLLAVQTRLDGDSTSARHTFDTTEESESVAWTETFIERLSHRADRPHKD
ncbi:hypothetical protein [Nocardia tengchongensis]